MRSDSCKLLIRRGGGCGGGGGRERSSARSGTKWCAVGGGTAIVGCGGVV